MPKFTLYTYTVSALYPQSEGGYTSVTVASGYTSRNDTTEAGDAWLEKRGYAPTAKHWQTGRGVRSFLYREFLYDDGAKMGKLVIEKTRLMRETR